MNHKSTYWSVLAFCVGLFNLVHNRDISANMFFAVVFIIQGLSALPAEGSNFERRIKLVCYLMSAALLCYCLISYAQGWKFIPPRTW